MSARDAATDSWPSSVSPTSARSPLRTTSSTPRGPALPTSRASEDILRTRSQSNLLPFDHPSLSPTYTSTPRTPASNNSSSRLSPAPSPHRLVHRHSPSMPTELDTFGHVGRGAGTIGDGYDDEKDEAHWSADQGAIESSSHDRNVPPPSVTKSNARPGGLVGLGFTDGLAPPSDEKSHLHSQSSLPPSPPSHSYTQGDGSGDSPPDKPFNINVFGASRTSLAPPPSTTTTTSTTTGSKEYADSLNSKNTTSKRRMVRNFFSGIKGR